jgi:hypothetical protein
LISIRFCRDSGVPGVKRRGGLAHSAISDPLRSPVLATRPGSDGSIAVSAPVREVLGSVKREAKLMGQGTRARPGISTVS